MMSIRVRLIQKPRARLRARLRARRFIQKPGGLGNLALLRAGYTGKSFGKGLGFGFEHELYNCNRIPIRVENMIRTRVRRSLRV